MCSLIYSRNKYIRDEPIELPTGRKFADYLDKQMQYMDNESNYADELIPPYLIAVVKNVAALSIIDGLLQNDKAFARTSDEFRASLFMQYIHMCCYILAAYLVQDLYIADQEQAR